MVARRSRRARLATRSPGCACGGAAAAADAGSSCKRCDDAVHLSMFAGRDSSSFVAKVVGFQGLLLDWMYVELCFGLARSPLSLLSLSRV